MKEYYKLCKNDSDEEIFFELVMYSPVMVNGIFSVKVDLIGLHDNISPIQGETAFQSIQNAIFFINKLLKDQCSDGFTLFVLNDYSKQYVEIVLPSICLTW
jgi:hypothetical protein